MPFPTPILKYCQLDLIGTHFSEIKTKIQHLKKMHLEMSSHDDVIEWNHFPRYWPFVWVIHRSPVNSPHKGQWSGSLMFSLICAFNKRLTKQTGGWLFETPSCSLWRHSNAQSVWSFCSAIKIASYEFTWQDLFCYCRGSHRCNIVLNWTVT